MRKKTRRKKATRRRSTCPRAAANGLRAAFRRGRRHGPALVAYVTAGDPNLKFTEKLVLRLAEAGKQVYLVEREPSIGGHMAQLYKTFPTLDCAA